MFISYIHNSMPLAAKLVAEMTLRTMFATYAASLLTRLASATSVLSFSSRSPVGIQQQTSSNHYNPPLIALGSI